MKKATVVIMLLALAAWAFPIHVASAELTNNDAVTSTQTLPQIHDEIRERNTQADSSKSNSESQAKEKQVIKQSNVKNNGQHSTRAEKQISVQRLHLYLTDRASPLASYSASIMESPYWSTIIGICTIEQYGCTKAPYNNYWGIMCKGKICHYATLEEGIKAIDSLLTKYEAKGKDTIEELNCYYVQPCSNSWLQTVLKTKQTLENL